MEIVPGHASLTHVGDVRLVWMTGIILSLLVLKASCVYFTLLYAHNAVQCLYFILIIKTPRNLQSANSCN